ncbi:MAG: sulfotransferase [Flavobacteriales bacterium]|jgi:hypothetical protein|nr:sulfotransferase [Flavobacteriales bacterium]
MASPSLLDRARTRFTNALKDLGARRIAGHLQVDPAKAILIFGAPRGGSTWLEELVRTIPSTATIWEPLDLENNPPFARIGFWWRQHIPEGEQWPEAEALFQDLLAGRMLSNYLTRTSTLGQLRAADRLVVKFIRGNLLLPWMVQRFPLPKPVLLIRHPCAVISSQKKRGTWDKFPVVIEPPPHRFDALYRSYQPYFNTASTFEERQAASWAADHKYLLEHPLNDVAWTTITYEELVVYPEATLRKLFSGWGMEIPAKALDLVRKPSSTVVEGSRVHDPHAQLSLWQSRMTPDEIQRALAMVHRFGIDLYDEGVMPTRSFTPGDLPS